MDKIYPLGNFPRKKLFLVKGKTITIFFKKAGKYSAFCFSFPLLFPGQAVYKATYISAIPKEGNQMIGKSMPRYGLLFILLVFFGCASTKADTRGQTDIKQLQETQISLNEKITALQQEHQELQKRMVGVQSELHAMAEELSDLKGYTKTSKGTASSREASSSALLEKELPPPDSTTGKQSTKESAPTGKTKTATATSSEKTKPDQISRKSLRIKVLSGNGDRSSAKQMSQKLKQLGYPVELIDMAPRSNFSEVVIYYLSSNKKDAEKLAVELGKPAIVKPLSWSSSFNLIIVTGKD